MVPRYVFNFYLVKNHKIDKNSTATKVRKKHRFGILEFENFLIDVYKILKQSNFT